MLEVACAADEGFVPHCAAMLHSLLAHHDAGQVRVHFLHDCELSLKLIGQLRTMVEEYGGLWRDHVITDNLRARFPDNRRFGRVAWYRVLLPELLPELGRILYLDADTLVLDSLETLWQTDLEAHALGAVANPLYPFMDDDFLGKLGLSHGTYFNSGVLLFNAEHWRREHISELVLRRAVDQGRQEWPDQNALNVVLKERWLALAPRWNAQNTVFDLNPRDLPFEYDAVLEARRSPAVVHFIGPYKPWHYRCKHALRTQYWQHLAATPWRGRPMEGVSATNRLLRLLPEQWGWQLEAYVRELRAPSG